jgi:hypothetical protein
VTGISPADHQAVEGRQTGPLGRPISDRPGELSGEQRRAWRDEWRLGRDECVANRTVVEAGVRVYGRGAPSRGRSAA